MKEVELKILDMSSVLKPSDSFALVLEEVGGEERKLALIIGAVEAQGIKMAEMHYRPPRPFTHDLLLNVMAVGRLQCLKGVIYQVKNGIYSTYLYIRRADGEVDVVDARTSDAIVLSLRAGFPLYVYEDILEKEHLTAEEVAYIGDDVTDIPLLKEVGFAATVPNAVDCVKPYAHYITKRVGGDGAYREVIDFILNARGKLKPMLEQAGAAAWSAGKKPEMQIVTSQEGIN